MTAHPHEPPRRPERIQHSRIGPVTAAVLLAHASALWLLGSGWIERSPPPGEVGQVIMASVVTDMPAPPAPTPQPAAPQAQPKPRLRPGPQTQAQPQMQTPPQPGPVAVATAPSENTPLVAAPAPSPASAAAAPPATGSQPQSTTQLAAAVALPSSDADYLNNPPPAYPRMSRRMGEQGTVLVRVFISTGGRAEKAELRTSSGYPRLDEAALETVKRWRYLPGKRAGVPEAMWFNVPIQFVLD